MLAFVGVCGAILWLCGMAIVINAVGGVIYRASQCFCHRQGVEYAVTMGLFLVGGFVVLFAGFSLFFIILHSFSFLHLFFLGV